MKKEFTFSKLFVSLLVVGSSFAFASCSSDDSIPDVNPETEELLASVEGIYTGSVETSNSEATREGETELPQIKATVTADAIEFSALEEVLATIQNREATEDEEEAVSFKVAYTRTLDEAKNEVKMSLESQTVEFSYTEEAVEGEEAQVITGSITFEATESGIYNIESKKLAVTLVVTEVKINDEVMEEFANTNLAFDLTQIEK